MGVLDRLMGNASEVDAAEINQELSPILADNEQVTQAFKLVRDLFVFTSHRLIFIDKQGMTGKKVDYHSIPYRAITQFKVETAGHFDMDAELSVWVSGQDQPLKTELSKNTALSLQKSLANAMF
ncbi:PH domain-containing protein [Alteromonas oceanisediminis]|uniref:PH domain-containing protein n=1 Tax=Alteromonas oceanisediminis TaxID=2836180 RepID=UPI001BDA8933|nr:PH domain-containing protein [Alteromonas oceanisediminis]MBT0585891.1 PH domain-containing protein [Alteromonas oceanisediminis]